MDVGGTGRGGGQIVPHLLQTHLALTAVLLHLLFLCLISCLVPPFFLALFLFFLLFFCDERVSMILCNCDLFMG